MEVVGADPGEVMLDKLAWIERERAKFEAMAAATMLDFSDTRRRQSELALDSDVGRLEASFAADEART